MDDGTLQQADPEGARQNVPTAIRRRILVWSVIATAVLLVLVGSLVYTEQSSFCKTCHEMRPYYAAWQAGSHMNKAECVDCHVDAGIVAHLAHKPTALKEVWSHFFVDSRFPNYDVPVPDSRCTGCHPTVVTKSISTFSHLSHAKQATCQACHTTTGHLVTLSALQAEGVLKAAATTPPVPAGLRPSAAPDHEKVVCQDCHDQATMECSACHKAPHELRGECSDCHRPGTRFVWEHGAKGTNCSQCHSAPALHFGAGCATCHAPGVPFEDTRFSHPARVGEHRYTAFPCAKCHPTGYPDYNCTCHGGRVPEGD